MNPVHIHLTKISYATPGQQQYMKQEKSNGRITTLDSYLLEEIYFCRMDSSADRNHIKHPMIALIGFTKSVAIAFQPDMSGIIHF